LLISAVRYYRLRRPDLTSLFLRMLSAEAEAYLERTLKILRLGAFRSLPPTEKAQAIQKLDELVNG
jgi:hypothetical protein